MKYVNSVISLQRTTIENIPNVFMLILINEKEMKEMSNNSCNDIDDPLRMNELCILVFDIYHRTVGNENVRNHIPTIAFDVRCNRKDFSLLKTLMVRC